MITADTRYPSWVEKYRPKTIQACIMPEALKATFQGIVDTGTLPNLLLHGGPGSGKTTAARAAVEELGYTELFINAALNRNIDTIRIDVTNFVSTLSFDGSRKVVIFDEAEHLNEQSSQSSLKGFIEDYASNASFIFTCNTPSKIIEPIHSRCTVLEFKIPKAEKKAMMGQFMKRVKAILANENVTCDNEVLAQLIMRYFPDFRRTLNELQGYSISSKGVIDTGILQQVKDIPFGELVRALSDADFKAMRTWVGANNDQDSVRIMRRIYDAMYDVFDPKSLPDLVLILGEYMHRAAFAQDKEVNLAACLTQIMMSTTVKAA